MRNPSELKSLSEKKRLNEVEHLSLSNYDLLSPCDSENVQLMGFLVNEFYCRSFDDQKEIYDWRSKICVPLIGYIWTLFVLGMSVWRWICTNNNGAPNDDATLQLVAIVLSSCSLVAMTYKVMKDQLWGYTHETSTGYFAAFLQMNFIVLSDVGFSCLRLACTWTPASSYYKEVHLTRLLDIPWIIFMCSGIFLGYKARVLSLLSQCVNVLDLMHFAGNASVSTNAFICVQTFAFFFSGFFDPLFWHVRGNSKMNGLISYVRPLMFMSLILMRCTFFRYLFDGVLSSNAIFVATASVQLIYNDTFVINSYVKRNVEFMFKKRKEVFKKKVTAAGNAPEYVAGNANASSFLVNQKKSCFWRCTDRIGISEFLQMQCGFDTETKIQERKRTYLLRKHMPLHEFMFADLIALVSTIDVNNDKEIDFSEFVGFIQTMKTMANIKNEVFDYIWKGLQRAEIFKEFYSIFVERCDGNLFALVNLKVLATNQNITMLRAMKSLEAPFRSTVKSSVRSVTEDAVSSVAADITAATSFGLAPAVKIKEILNGCWPYATTMNSAEYQAAMEAFCRIRINDKNDHFERGSDFFTVYDEAKGLMKEARTTQTRPVGIVKITDVNEKVWYHFSDH